VAAIQGWSMSLTSPTGSTIGYQGDEHLGGFDACCGFMVWPRKSDCSWDAKARKWRSTDCPVPALWSGLAEKPLHLPEAGPWTVKVLLRGAPPAAGNARGEGLQLTPSAADDKHIWRHPLLACVKLVLNAPPMPGAPAVAPAPPGPRKPVHGGRERIDLRGLH
jgi:hypothetical protein